MLRQLGIVMLVSTLAACQPEVFAPKTSEGASTPNSTQPLPGTPGGTLLAALRGEASVEDCPNGGIEIEYGIDEDLSGVLDENEVDGTEIICNGLNGTDGESAAPCATIAEDDGSYTIACPGRDPITVRDGDRMLFHVSSVGPSAQCPDGGVRLDVGADEDQDGELDESEMSASELICAGAQGPGGEPCQIARESAGVYTVSCPGVPSVTIRSGQSASVSFEPISPGRKCAHGGLIYRWGRDQNNNRVLDADEILVSAALCTPPAAAQFCERYRYTCGDWPSHLVPCETVWRNADEGGPGQIIGPRLSCFDYALFQAESTSDLQDRGAHCRAARGQAVCIAPDADDDGVANDDDNCPLTANADQADLDDDQIGDACDGDVDGDGVPRYMDCDDTNMQAHTAVDDLDCDGISNLEDSDADGDGVVAGLDCDDYRPERLSRAMDLDCDGIPNVEDADADGDGVRLDADCDDLDAGQGSYLADLDCDGIGDATDSDADGDGVESQFDCDDRRADRGDWRVDQDCDGIQNTSDFDRDGDGLSANLDCDDRDPDNRDTRRETADGTDPCND